MTYFLNPNLLVHSSPVHGLGIFANENFNEGELLECSPFLELALPFDLLNDKVLRDYVFLNKKEELAGLGPKTYLGLGYISLYNHQDKPNAKIVFDYKHLTACITALKDIQKGEEIFISYGASYFKFRKLYHILSEEVKKRLLENDKNG